tara:strand:+ start:469 stop:1041 length:573 start_codon:yes stop_codon:yes gene_type:complete
LIYYLKLLYYSYLRPFTGSSLDALIAGKIETNTVINIEHKAIIMIDGIFISEGILLKKYISSGKILILNILLIKILIFSIYMENITPRKIPKIVAEVPIIIPTRKNIFFIDLLRTPIDLSIAISLVLFLTSIVRPEIILNAATTIIKDRIINITFLSTFRAENKDLFKSAHVKIYSSENIFCRYILVLDI